MSQASVILGGAVVLVLIAVPLALISARFPRSPLDRAVVAVSLIGISTHPLVIGLVLQLLFSVHWHWLAGGYCNFFPHRPPSATATSTSSRRSRSRSAKGRRTGRPT